MSNKYETSFGDVTLKVTPDKMYQVANDIETKVKKTQKLFENMMNTISKTSTYWDGTVADQERGNFSKENEKFSALIVNLNNYAAELKAITAIYEITEEQQKIISQSLPTDILT